MSDTSRSNDFSVPDLQVAVILPRGGDEGEFYFDCIGSTRAEAMANFTRFGKHDLSLSEIFHLDFGAATVVAGGDATRFSGEHELILPFDRTRGQAAVRFASTSREESVLRIGLAGANPDDFEFIEARVMA